MIGLTRNKSSNVIPGVAIATALMPPLCTAGYGIATAQIKIFLGAGYLFFINAFFIAISTFIVTKMLRLHMKNKVDSERESRIKRIIIIASVIVMIPSIISAVWMIRKTIYEKDLNYFISSELPEQYILSKNIDYKNNIIELVTIGDVITSDKLRDLNKSLSSYGLKDKKLDIKQEGIDLNNLDQYINSLKENQKSVSTDIDKEDSDKLDKESIFKEIKAIYPQIKEVYTGYIYGEAKENNDIAILIIYSDDSNFINNINNIESWFKVRINSDKVKVYIENPKS